ncbi:hypothetical protein MMC14_005627 [Varicellaria rhodocarpa]|nr:hypothetical protein [Varicellaria rhodocarpa]
MDGHMEITKYYTFSTDDSIDDPIVALKSSSEPFSNSELKNYPICRRPLRNINRYGRIVRRAWIDEATKKFIVWANSSFVPLASRMEQVEAGLRKPIPKPGTTEALLFGHLSSALDTLSLEPIHLGGPREAQLNVIRKAAKSDIRYKDVFLLRRAIYDFRQEADKAEQPISRIHDLIQDAHKHHRVNTEDVDLPSILQVRNRLLATVLLLRCMLSDLVTHSVGTGSDAELRDLRLDFALNRKDCEVLIAESRVRQQPAQRVEGLLYWARFAALERHHSAKLSEEDMTMIIERARHQLYFAQIICKTHLG